MVERIAEVSPRFKARMDGVFEALEGLTSAYGQVVVLGRLVVAGNAAATAADIVGHERLFWLGFHIAPSRRCFHIVWVFHFYKLFKPVDKGVSLLAAFVGLVVCAMQALTGLLYLAPLLILLGGSSLSAFTEPQLQALALIFLKLNSSAFDVDLVFFGLWCTLTGYLIIRVDLFASNFGNAVGDRRFRLDALYVPAARLSSVPIHRYSLRLRGIPAAAMAHRVRREQSTLDRAGQRCERDTT